MMRIFIIVTTLSILSACATSQTSAPAKAYPKGYDLFDEFYKGNNLYDNKQYAEALTIYERLVLSVPEDAELWFRKGNIHARLNQPRKAIDAYQQAVLRDQQYYKAWRNMTTIQLRQTANTLTQLVSVLSPNHPYYEDSVKLTENVLKLLGETPQKSDVETSETEQGEEQQTITVSDQSVDAVTDAENGSSEQNSSNESNAAQQ